MFCTDSRTENFLQQLGVKFEYTHQVSFDDLVKTWDVTNIARPVAKRDDAILEYAALTESGSSAPAPILHRLAEGYEVLDGVQRLAASQLCGEKIIAAYVVTCDSEDLLSAVRVLANARLQGRPEPPEWTKRKAVEVLVLQRHMSIEQVARMGGWKSTEVTAIARVLDWGFQIRCIGGPQQLPDTILDCLAQHTTQEELKKAPQPISQFLQAIAMGRFSASDAKPFIEEFFKPVLTKKRHETYAERLQEFLEEPECQVRLHGRKSVPLSRDVALRRSLRASLTILDQIAKEDADVLYVDEFFKLTKEINEKLHALSARHAKAVKVRVPADMYERPTK